MPFKYPDIKVGAHTYKTTYKTLGDDVYGCCARDLRRIHLNDNFNMCHSSELQVFTHELLHAIEDVYLDARLTEEQIDQMAEGLLQVLQDNPKLRGIYDGKKLTGRGRSSRSDTTERG